MTLSTTKESWEAELMDKFYKPNYPNGWSIQVTITELKQFISDLLLLKQKRVRREVMQKIYNLEANIDDTHYTQGYDKACDDILNLLGDKE